MVRLLVLIPSFNGGARLLRTVESCAGVDLGPGELEVLVVDNASTDGSLAALPQRLANGVPVRIAANPSNVGRVENWNRALELAEQAKASYAAFLFVGDIWLPKGQVRPLLDEMDRNGAIVGLPAYRFQEESGAVLREARRFWFPGAMATVPPREFLQQTVARGILPMGPLQAHVLRIAGAPRLRFDPSDPTHTDQVAMVLHLAASGAPCVLSHAPYYAWTRHPGRFHATMDHVARMAHDQEVLAILNQDLRLESDPAVRNANLLLLVAAQRRVNEIGIRTLMRIAGSLRRRGGMSMRALASGAWERLVRRRGLVRFG